MVNVTQAERGRPGPRYLAERPTAMKIVLLHMFVGTVLFLAQIDRRVLLSRGRGALQPRRVQKNRRRRQ
jgi:hypothetical protein